MTCISQCHQANPPHTDCHLLSGKSSTIAFILGFKCLCLVAFKCGQSFSECLPFFTEILQRAS